MDQLQLGDTFPVQMGWTLPDGKRLQVTFGARVEALEPDKNRVRCRLLQVQAAGGNRPQAEMDPYYFDRVMGLIGKQALIPLDACQGIVLPLRLATLTGEHHFFFRLDCHIHKKARRNIVFTAGRWGSASLRCTPDAVELLVRGNRRDRWIRRWFAAPCLIKKGSSHESVTTHPRNAGRRSRRCAKWPVGVFDGI